MTKPTKPARRYIAEGREVHDHDQTFWGAYWAHPGMIPEWVTDQADGLPLVFERRQDAALSAKVALANALLNKSARVTTDTPLRYQHMTPADFAADLQEAGINPTVFARVHGTRPETVTNQWLNEAPNRNGHVTVIPHSARVLLALFQAYPGAIGIAKQVTAESTIDRRQDTSLNEVVAPS